MMQKFGHETQKDTQVSAEVKIWSETMYTYDCKIKEPSLGAPVLSSSVLDGRGGGNGVRELRVAAAEVGTVQRPKQNHLKELPSAIRMTKYVDS